MKKTEVNQTTIGLPGLLLILFIALKLTDVIDWSWWWVLSPVWITLGFGLLAAGFIMLVKAWYKMNKKNKKT